MSNETKAIEATSERWWVDKDNPTMVVAEPPKTWRPTPQHPKYVVFQTGVYCCTSRAEQERVAILAAAAPALRYALKAVIEFAEAPASLSADHDAILAQARAALAAAGVTP